MNDYLDYLQHHGIKGQKWGVRRFQNEDGTYTSRGRKRYALDRDINDKSRLNIAKIRTGEARRRYDVAKANNETNVYRLADLRGRVKAAKRNERAQRQIDKGAKLEAKGRTISGNRVRAFMAVGAASMASKGVTALLNKRLSTLSSEGKMLPRTMYAANIINKALGYGIQGAAIGYGIKQDMNSMAIRRYRSAKWQGDTSIKRVGSQEYADVVKRRQGK